MNPTVPLARQRYLFTFVFVFDGNCCSNVLYQNTTSFPVAPPVGNHGLAISNIPIWLYYSAAKKLRSTAGSPLRQGNQLFLVNETNQTCEFIYTIYLQSLLYTTSLARHICFRHTNMSQSGSRTGGSSGEDKRPTTGHFNSED